MLIRYWDWISHFVRGDLGISYQYKVSVASLVAVALNSIKLGLVAIVLVVPDDHRWRHRCGPAS